MEVIYVAREALAITKNKELHQSGKRRTPRDLRVNSVILELNKR